MSHGQVINVHYYVIHEKKVISIMVKIIPKALPILGLVLLFLDLLCGVYFLGVLDQLKILLNSVVI